MLTVARQNRVARVLNFILTCYAVILFQIYTQIRVVPVAPLCRLTTPRQTSTNEIETAKLVVPKVTGQLRIVFDNLYNVLCRGFNRALTVVLQILHPFGICRYCAAPGFLQIHVGKICGRVCPAFLSE